MILLFFVFWITLVIATISFLIYRKGIGVIFSNPIVLGTIFFTILHLFMPMIQESSSFYRYQKSYTMGAIILSVLLVIIGQIIYNIFHLSFKTDYHKVFKKIKVNDLEIGKIINVNILIYLIGAYFAYKNYSRLQSIGELEYIRDRIGFGKGKGLFLLLPHWVYISSFIFYVSYLLAKKKRLKRKALLFTLISFVSSFLYYSANGNRNSIFLMFILLGGAWLISNPSFNTKLNKKQGKRLFFITLGIFLAFTIFFNIGKDRYKFYAQHNKKFKYSTVKSLNGAFGNHENVIWLLNNEHKKFYGATYIAGFTNFVPRSLWKNKPLGAGPKLKNFIYPDSYVIGRKRNSSLTTGFFTELKMNFGSIGILFFPAIFAIILGYILKYLNESNYLIIKMASFFTMVAFFTQFYYAEFLGFFSRYIISILPFVLIYFTCRLSIKHYKNSNMSCFLNK